MKRSTGVYPNVLRNDTPKAWETQGLTSGKQCLGATQPDFTCWGKPQTPDLLHKAGNALLQTH